MPSVVHPPPPGRLDIADVDPGASRFPRLKVHQHVPMISGIHVFQGTIAGPQ